MVLPAVIAIIDRSRFGRKIPEPGPVHSWLRPFAQHPRLVLLAAVAGTLALSSGIHDLRYDHNLLNLQPEGLESVEVEKKLAD